MATLLPVGTLTDDKFKQIQDMLSIIPIDKEEEERKKWMNMAKSKIPSKPKEIIPMFLVDYIEKIPYIRIPFRFACALQGKLVNREPEQVELYPKIDFQFKATLRPAQIPVAQEAYAQLAATGTTTLCLPTGFGKTLLSLYMAGLCRNIIAVNLPSQSLIESWSSTFIKCYPDCKDRIWIVGENEMPENPALILFMYTRFDKIPPYLRRQIGCYIIDECHLHCTVGKVGALLSITPRYVIALSATPERNDSLENMIYTIVGTHRIERLSENPFQLIKLKTGIKIEEERGMFGLNYSAFVNNQANSLERNSEIINIIHGNRHRKFMILTKTKEHVTNLENLFKHYGMPCTTYFGSKKNYKDEKILIGSLSKLSTGFDTATSAVDFDGINANVLILATTIKNKALFRQTIGRVVGRAENPVVVYLIDKNSTQTRHFNETKELVESCKGNITTIEYDETIPGGGVVLS